MQFRSRTNRRLEALVNPELKLLTESGESNFHYTTTNVVMEGVCLNSITGNIPMFPLDGVVLRDIKNEYAKVENPTKLPSLAKEVGGQVDFMIGSKYLKYHPKVLFELPSGLTIYESVFINSDGGGRGVVCGPHHTINSVGSDCNI